MKNKPALTPTFCLDAVVNSTLFPSRFKEGTDDPSTVTLFDLGVTGPTAVAVFVQAVKKRILPWKLDDVNFQSSRDTTLQVSAASIAAGAFIG